MFRESVWARVRAAVLGRPRDLSDRALFHKLSLVAVLAWVGLGADGLSSSCYGPEETYKALGRHPALAVFVAFACVGTIAVLCASYRQIIELFPTGGGGYLVASKLLGIGAGVVSGSALLVDYVLTIAISVASGADALFSLLPADYQPWKLPFACGGIAVMTVLNLRGVRESVLLWAPVFFAFILTHAVAILVAVGLHLADVSAVAGRTAGEVRAAHAELGLAGMLLLMLRAFSVGAGTYTGIEAVSNGLPVLREPQVETGKRTMTLMGVSLAVTVFGLLLAYLLVGVTPVDGKTLNAVLFEAITATWPGWLGRGFVLVGLVSATALLFVAAQAGFLDGPRVLATMAQDRWFPTRFATLSDRFVTQNGILLMGSAALAVLLLTGGSVGLLVVLYSINVFLTFSLSQLGMCTHWVRQRRFGGRWAWGLAVNGVGLAVTAAILVALTAVKFGEGGWVTVLATSAVVGLACLVRRHYDRSAREMAALDAVAAEIDRGQSSRTIPRPEPGRGRTAVLLCNGYNGLGVHAFFRLFRMFPGTFDRCVFVLVGLVDAGAFKGADEIDRLRERTAADAEIDRGQSSRTIPRPEPGRGRTAVLLCNGYNGLGVHAFFRVFRMFPGTFDRCVFVLVGLVDAGAFKGADEIDRLRARTAADADRYAALCRRCGLDAEVRTAVGNDLLETIQGQVAGVLTRYPDAVVFGGQLAFRSETVWTRWLHNYVVFALQRLYCRQGVPFVIVPVRV